MRTELVTGLKKEFNALASSVVLVCRPRAVDARLATRREFTSALRTELPDALRQLQQGNIAPVDLAQAAIGPGMAVFSRFAKVLEADGSPMRTRTALGLINQVLDEVLTEQESEYDPATRWAIAWFEQFGMDEGGYGGAETLSKAKNTSVASLVTDGFLYSRAGKVRLLRRDELPEGWDPAAERNLSVWELTQHLIRQLELNGDSGAAALLGQVGSLGEIARDLAYRLYTTCERKKWAQEALAYNSLVVAWPEIMRLSQREPAPVQEGML
jgi:putative DNA methylase